jgi:adenine-specific DNA methylase
MIPRQCKRLAEVDFPIAAVSRHSVREKSIRHGHPSTLHLWWARRPLAACRAVLMGLLLPDPCDPLCPQGFKAAARRALKPVPGIADPRDAAALRKALLQFIADFANWDHSAVNTYLDAARALVKAAHGEEPPLVVDPFAGGGSIPLEALRTGCDAFASDLNPVACLILKVLLEDIPRHGTQLADELRRVGVEIKAAAEKELAQYYPPDLDGSRPIAYLWARTVRCESPNCGAEIPLARSFWLCKKPSRRRALRYEVKRPQGKLPHVELEIFEPKSEAAVPRGTVAGANATCPCCNVVLPAPRVRVQLAAQRGGADTIFDEKGKRVGGARLLAVVTLKKNVSGRHYRLPEARDYVAIHSAKKAIAELPKGAVPDEPLPPIGTLGFRVQRYGMVEWGDLFSARQKLALVSLAAGVRRLAPKTEVGSAARKLLAGCLAKQADLSNSLCGWEPYAECPKHLFGRQAIPIVWDFPEGTPVGESSGSWSVLVQRAAYVLAELGSNWSAGQTRLADACNSPLPDEACSVWFIDPPYYDAIPYSDLSDFFLVWLKRALPEDPLLRDPFDPSNPLSPKMAEIVQDETRGVREGVKDGAFFERQMGVAFGEGHRVLSEDGIGCVVFAHKTTEGWEALLSGMLHAGWVITASWPITTEMGSRLRARDSAALAASVHLICRPRSADAPVGGWEDILRALPVRIGEWMERLAGERIRGADLVFSCIGPAMELFSRYPKVETAEGEEIGLAPNPSGKSPAAQRGFLSYVWEAVGRAALRQVLGQAEGEATNSSAAAALEEDARLTALFLWTLQSTANGNGDTAQRETDAKDEADDEDDADGASSRRRARTPGFTLIYDIARRFAQPLGIHLDEWEGRVVEIDRGIVRLLSVSERSEQLFGSEGAAAMAEALERGSIRDPQLMLFPEDGSAAAPRVRGRARRSGRSGQTESERRREPTTLDRVHAAMLLQASGQSGALRALLEDDPKNSEEKRLVDAMLVAVPRR